MRAKLPGGQEAWVKNCDKRRAARWACCSWQLAGQHQAQLDSRPGAHVRNGIIQRKGADWRCNASYVCLP